MFRGAIEPRTGRLYVRARVEIPDIGATVTIPFQIDTGADSTLVALPALVADGLSLARLPLTRSASRIRGVGGSISGYDLRCRLVFEDGLKSHWYDLTAGVPDPRRYGNLPYILGRDVLRRWRMVYDEPRSVLTFTVRSADRTYTRRAAPRPRA